MKIFSVNRVAPLIIICLGFALPAVSQSGTAANGSRMDSVDKTVSALMKAGNIPGLSLVIVQDGQPVIKTYGYADLDSKRPVTDNTLFEIGSCTKAFTALAIAKLIHEHKLSLNDYVSDYIPWFRVRYKDSLVSITIAQLLHHTSGIPWSSISNIPQTKDEDALVKTVRNLEGQELKRLPGKKYEYATINYDVLALVIQNISGQPFETYIRQQIFDMLQLSNTSIGIPVDSALMSKGYKIGFFKPRVYDAPVFRGNYAAGYVITDARDFSKWLQFQMGLKDTSLYELAAFTQQRDETVPLHFYMSAYAMGWNQSFEGNGEVYHGGVNPNYTAYIQFRKKSKLGVAVLANSNSTFTPVIANRVMKLLAGEKIEKEYDPGDGNDKVFSTASIILGLYLLALAFFIGRIIFDIIKGKRKYAGFSRAALGRIGLLLVIFLPYVYGLYLLPTALFGFSWESMIVWTPFSLTTGLKMLSLAMGVSLCTYIAGVAFPEKDKFRRIAPRLILLSVLSGLANMLLIILITSSLDLDNIVELKYLIFYYCLTLSVYLFGRRFVQVSLVAYTMDMIYELRIKITDKIFSTSYQNFEKIDRGRVYTALNDDVGTIGESANVFVVLVTSIFTAGGALLYLASIAFWATILTFSLMGALTTMYFFVSKSTNKFYEAARDSRNVFMRLINGMIDGYKELTLHRNRKKAYKEDVAASADEYKKKITVANIRFVNASFVGEAVLVLILGVVALGFPKLFPGIKVYTLMSFVIVLLYLIGPVNTILNSVPTVLRLRIALNRIKQFLNSIPSDPDNKKLILMPTPATINSMGAKGIAFQYRNGDDQDPFSIGPIDLEMKKGEIVFIVGGNGSGKTTFAKLLTGLYEPDRGKFTINGEEVPFSRLGEHFSAVFSPVHLFEKLYDIDISGREEEVNNYLKLLHLDEKVRINGNKYSTINLSGGQRKRLALLQVFLEDCPVCLFDEWAADQDPAYRFFFYRTLLPQMRKKGKIIIAITHDDHYFDVADKVYKMDQGQLLPWESSSVKHFVI